MWLRSILSAFIASDMLSSPKRMSFSRSGDIIHTILLFVIDFSTSSVINLVMIQVLRGMKDILPPESKKWQKMQKAAEEIFTLFGYSLVITPIVEKTELFSRSVGETTDVVSKEMYTFTDKGGDSVTLRPEGTASVVRAYFSSPEWKERLLKAWYWGPMFRYERPQKGRYRQFFQFGLEAIGTDSPYVDAELIFLLDVFYKKLGITDVNVEINSLGCEACRPLYKDELIKFLVSKKELLCEDCKNRLLTNPLRTLDCKNEKCIEIISKSPAVSNYLCADCKTHNTTVLETLDDVKIKYTINPNLVRGLDYYSRTVFEFTSLKLGGRQNALGGGGRYDNLSVQLGEKKIPSVGYAGGIERTLLMMEESAEDKNYDLYLAVLDDKTLKTYLPMILELKKHYPVNTEDFRSRDVKKHLSRADKSGARFALIAGENETNAGVVIIKDLLHKKEHKVKADVKEILGRLLEEKNS
ncbi:MAG: histidine--tRNA ligase [Pseudomonadota bacterium]